jgi:hypothetical protein
MVIQEEGGVEVNEKVCYIIYQRFYRVNTEKSLIQIQQCRHFKPEIKNKRTFLYPVMFLGLPTGHFKLKSPVLLVNSPRIYYIISY